jgi:LEA14-like dessication related protein
MKVYNPYEMDIPLKKLKFGLAYLNDYKQVKDVRPLSVEQTDSTILMLKSNDTLNFTFKLPRTKIEHPKYIQIGISENGLPFGINSKKTELK